MLFVDIDGCVIDFNIQKYVGKIKIFGNEPIRNLEYIIKCVEHRLMVAKKENSHKEVEFIEYEVLDFVKNNLYERLKECRDCFLEYDNYKNNGDKQQYINLYKESIINSSNKDLTNIFRYLESILKYSYQIIKKECADAWSQRRKPILPFSIINDDNDIISESIDGININAVMYEKPVERALSALNYIGEQKNSYNNCHDDFLVASEMIGDEQIVDYNEIYSRGNLVLGAREALKDSLDSCLFSDAIFLSHHTGEREVNAKKQLFEVELPFVTMNKSSLMKFHSEQAKMNVRRTRSSKALQAIEIMRKLTGVASISECYLIDDSPENLVNWNMYGGRAILYRPRTKEEIATGIDKRVDERFVRMFNWSTSELERVVKCFETKNKQFIKK